MPITTRTRAHSTAFLQLIASAVTPRETRRAIRAAIHAAPLLVFWVSPDGRVINAGNAHHKNPPLGDRSVLADPTNKGHLRGRAAKIGDVIYVVIYGDQKYSLSRRQYALLRRSWTCILATLSTVVSEAVADLVDAAKFIDEVGADLTLSLSTPMAGDDSIPAIGPSGCHRQQWPGSGTSS